MNNAVISILANKSLPTLTRTVGRRRLVLKKQSPHIFFVAGIVGSVTSTVLACKATLRLPDTLSEIEKDISQDKKDKHAPDRETALVYAKAALKLTKLYAPALGVGVFSISALSGSHIALSRRNTALMAAYSAVSKAYDDYRRRIMEELGEERELDIYHAAKQMIDDQDEDTCVVDPNQWSPYARFFDEASPNWEKNAELNRLFVQCQQNYANELLRARGHLFLNEVYDMLGIDRSQAGQVVGWVVGNSGDNYVDFGMYNAVNARFINGWERSILLDFNVDGVVYDKI